MNQRLTHWLRGEIYVLLFALGLLTACTQDSQQSLRAIPNAFGDLASLTIIADQDLWDGPLGDTIRYYYSSAFLILPQPEPILDLKFFTPQQLDSDRLRRELRTYLIVANLDDDLSPAAKLAKSDLGPARLEKFYENPANNLIIGRDKWAKGQMVVYQLGQDRNNLLENLKKNLPVIIKQIRLHDRVRLDATVYLDGRNYKLERELRDQLRISLRIPGDYQQAISDGDVMWIRKETEKSSLNLIFHRLPYSDAGQLSRENIMAVRDSLGKKYISTRVNDTYMVINDKDLPLFTNTVTISGKYALEARGIWEIENDYMAGPFLSCLIHDPKNGELIFIDAFVYAPGEDKRDYMLYLEHIINTLQIP